MAAAIEERGTRKVLDRNDAIKALKKEIDVLKAEKTQQSLEVASLNVFALMRRTFVARLKLLTRSLKV
jgi:cell division protein FtsB